MFAAKNIFTFKKANGGGNAQSIFYALVGGGGNGGLGANEFSYGYTAGGGGGGGQVLTSTYIPTINSPYQITVCPNGSSATRPVTSAFGFTAVTGGDGGAGGSTLNIIGKTGAQGGGGSYTYGSGSPYAPSYYGAGGSSSIGSFVGGTGSPDINRAGGGGGAGGNGVNGASGGAGGAGTSITIAGASQFFAGGGGGGKTGSATGAGAAGGSGIGGTGGFYTSTIPFVTTSGTNGVLDTGSGGGGSPYQGTTGKGANGVVFIWYFGVQRANVSGLNVTTTTQNGFTLHKFTGDGNISFTS